MRDREIEQAAFRTENWTSAQVLSDGRCIQGGGHDHQFEIRAHGGLKPAQQGQGQISLQMPLVKLIQHDYIDVREPRVRNQAARQDSFREEAQAGIFPGDFFEPDLIAGGLPDPFAEFLRNPSCREPGCQAPRLKHEDLALHHGQQSGRNASGLARSRRRFNDQIGALSQRVQDRRQEIVDGKKQRRAGYGFFAGGGVAGAPALGGVTESVSYLIWMSLLNCL